MIRFAVTFPASRPKLVGKEFNFGVCGTTVLFAGSRHRELNHQLCAGLLSAFSSRGAHFLTGCCSKGVDLSVRRALVDGGYHDRSFVAAAFGGAADKMELASRKVVPDGLPAKVALAKRTVFMCGEASVLVLFPSEPIGKGSGLALKTMLQANKPVFLVTESEPEPSPDYEVFPATLFGLASGFWLLPHVYPSGSSRMKGTTKKSGYFEKVSKGAKRKVQPVAQTPKPTTSRVKRRFTSASAIPPGVL